MNFMETIVYKLRNIVGKFEFFYHFCKSVICYNRKRYNTDVIKQSACLAVNPITVDQFAYLFNCTPLGRGSDSVMPTPPPDLKPIHQMVRDGLLYFCFLAHRGSASGFLLLRYSGVLFDNPSRKHTYIILIPLNPTNYLIKLGFIEVYIIFLISSENIDCRYSLEPPRRGGSNEYQQSMFWAEIWKILEFFYLKIFIFWW